MAATRVIPLILLLAGSGSVFAQDPSDTGDIPIGHYGSLSGSKATFGQSTENGITLAVEEFNAAGGLNGRKIRLISYDDQGKADEVGTAVIRLITHDKVVAVLGEVASSLSLAAAPVCQQYKVPMITPSSTNPQVTAVGDMIFRVCFIDPFQGYVCAKFAREHEKASRIAMLVDQASAYSVGLADEFARHFESMGGTIVTYETYKEGDSDFTPQLSTIRGLAPDMIFIPGYYTDVANIAIQARKLGITCPMLGGDGWDSSDLSANAAKAIEGCFYSNHYSQEDSSPRVQNFIKRFRERFGGQTPDGLAALGYDAAQLLFNAMQRAKSLKGPDLAAALANTKDLQLVTGKITIDENRNARKPAVILKLVDGKWRYLTTIEPGTDEEMAAGGERHSTGRTITADMLLQALTATIIVGSLYALIALGYTMVYGILKFINFAHSDVVAFGAWFSLVLASKIAPGGDAVAGWWVGGVVLVAAMAACALLGFLIEYLAYRPLRSAPRLNCLITAIGVSLLLQNTGQLPQVFGNRPRRIETLIPSTALWEQTTANGSSYVLVSSVDAIILVSAMSLMVALQFLVYRTRLGLAMRAVSFSPQNAALMGIPVNRVISLTFCLGAALAAAAGFLFALKYPVLPQTADASWVMLGLKAFVAAVVGGIGNFAGAVLGGFVIATIEQFGAALISPNLREVYVFSILILVLLFRPAGLLGSTVREKV